MPTPAEYQYLREQAKRLRPLYNCLRNLRSNGKTDIVLRQAMADSAESLLENLGMVTQGIADYAVQRYPAVARGQLVRITMAGPRSYLGQQGGAVGKVVEFDYFEPSFYAEEFHGDLILHGVLLRKDRTRGRRFTLTLDAANRYSFEIVHPPL